MTDDAITRQPPPRAEVTPPAPIADSAQALERKNWYDLWEPRQRIIFAIKVMAPLAVLSFLMAYNYAYIQLLWIHPLGVKMSMGAAVMLLLSLAIYAGGTALLNWTMPREDQAVVRRALCALLLFFETLFLYLPVFFVMLVGPSILQILDNL